MPGVRPGGAGEHALSVSTDEPKCVQPSQARASVRLAELESTQAVWLVATMLDNLVKGEVMQVRPRRVDG
eukprot:773636-Pyramimonas_sp.AAC.1